MTSEIKICANSEEIRSDEGLTLETSGQKVESL